MKKLIILCLLAGGLLFGGIMFFSPHEPDAEELKKLLNDNYSAFSSVASYFRTNTTDIKIIYEQDAKKLPAISDDLSQVFSSTLLCIKPADGIVVFSTGNIGDDTSHYIIYSPDGEPKGYPDAFSAGKTNWYLA